MSVINGRIVGFKDRDFILHTGSDGEGGGGKIYPVDAAAVEHFKAVIAQQEATKRPSPTQRRASRPNADTQRKIDGLLERARLRVAAAGDETGAADQANKKEYDMRTPRMSDQEIIAAHRRYVVEAIGLDMLSSGLPLTQTPLKKAFSRLNLPTRGHQGWRSQDDVARVCEVHGLSLTDVPGDVVEEARAKAAPPAKAAAKKPARKTRPAQLKPLVNDGPATAVTRQVVPVQETAVATNGHAQPGDLRQQLTIIQELLGLAEAKSIGLRGKISIELHAEVVF